LIPEYDKSVRSTINSPPINFGREYDKFSKKGVRYEKDFFSDLRTTGENLQAVSPRIWHEENAGESGGNFLLHQ